jgi:outer membrane lipoprotein-sorting protein
MRRRLLWIMLPFLLAQTKPAGIDPVLLRKLEAINLKTASVTSLTANFQQQKFTAMLTQPLVSYGKLIARGPVMLWSTADPEVTQMRIDSKQIEIYYPSQKTVEVYPIEQKLATLAASPLPKLSILEKYFTFHELPMEQNPRHQIYLQLTPIGELSQHIKEVKVLLEADTGLLMRMELVDTDQDTTIIDFSNIRTNIAVDDTDMELKMPRDVKVTHPLAGIESEGP